jgi:DNA polymerase I-like protein with 3'-5' exonuclease and polymerase domains
MIDGLAYKLPNVRKLFIPDKGYAIFDVDLSGADAQVVAWDADDEDLMAAFKAGLKIHIKNYEDMTGIKFDPARDKKAQPGSLYSAYDEMKRGVHATNYVGSARTLAITLGWKVARAEAFQKNWFKRHPKIKTWHGRINRSLQLTRSVTNAYGYKRTYFDRIEGILPEAVAWIPQSTIGIVCSKGGVRLCVDKALRLPWVEPLLQVHDSLVFQIPFAKITPANLELVRDRLHVPVPYPDPLTIPWGLSLSSKSWGDCKEPAGGWSGEGIDEALR